MRNSNDEIDLSKLQRVEPTAVRKYKNSEKEELNKTPAPRKKYKKSTASNNASWRKRYAKSRQECLDHYGRVCACCGEKEEVFLQIDHIGGGGEAHRRQIKDPLTMWLRKNGFPSGYQILCANCNAAKHILGRCPHQKTE
jgi:hypothetical protein